MLFFKPFSFSAFILEVLFISQCLLKKLMQGVIARASSEVRPTSAEVSDEIPNLVVDDVEPTSDEEKSSPRRENASRSHRGRSRGPGSAKGSRKRRTPAPRKAILVNNSDTSDNNNRSTKGRKRKAAVNTDNIVEKRLSTSEETSKGDVCCFHFNYVIKSKYEFA